MVRGLIEVKLVREPVVALPYFGFLLFSLGLHGAVVSFRHLHRHLEHAVVQLLGAQVLILGVEALSPY